jgi:hypothetical protein
MPTRTLLPRLAEVVKISFMGGELSCMEIENVGGEDEGEGLVEYE